ncbi:MAG: DUF6516 family protein [Candidatus Nanohalobium sp.]
MAELIWQREDYIGDDIDIVATLWKLEDSDEFRYNLKYNIQATDYSKDGETVLRYDNANNAHAARRHKHIEKESSTRPIKDPFRDVDPDNTEEVVEAMEELWKKFKQEVEEHHED